MELVKAVVKSRVRCVWFREGFVCSSSVQKYSVLLAHLQGLLRNPHEGGC